MKVVFQRAGQVVEFSRHGRVVFWRDEAGAEREEGFFDDRAAEGGLQVLLDRYRQEGWAEPPEVLAAQARAAAEATARAAALSRQLTWHLSLTEQADAPAAFQELAGPLLGSTDATVLKQLSADVVKLGDATEHGVTVFFRGGAEIDWSGDEVTVYARPSDREAERPCLEYAVTSGPPLGDEEIEGEVTGDITWFMNEFIYSYWFFTSDEPNRARKWNHDGGIAPDPIARRPVQALADLLVKFTRQK